MKQKLNLSQFFKATFLVIFLLVEFFGFGSSTGQFKAQAQGSMYTSQNCSGAFCTNVISSLTQGATGIDPNTTVNLNFSITLNAGQTASNCTNSSHQLFHSVKHYTGSSYEYLYSGAGPSVDANFNSGPVGNQNRYVGMFYCWTQSFNNKSSLDALFSSGVQTWQTPEFNLTTRDAVANSNQYGCVAANGVYACTADANNQAMKQACTDNNSTFGTITPSDKCGCTDANYAAGTCKNGVTSTPSPTPTGMQNNAKDKLYNPLPEEDLVHTFLVIAQGLLGILGILAVIFIIVGGFQLVVAAGNEEAIIKGKKMISWSIIGLVIALLSFSIISIVENLLQVSIQPAPPLGIIESIKNLL